MNALKIAKLTVYTLSILLIAGFCLIVSKIADTQAKSNPKNIHKTIKTNLLFNKNEALTLTFSCGNYLCLKIQKNNLPYKIIVLTPDTGKIINEISFQTK